MRGNAELDADTIIVGAGLIGLCTALELARSGSSVTIVDRSDAGSGASRGNAGEITPLSVLPLAGPGMIREMLAGLVSRRGPLSIAPASLPALVPFGAGFMRASLRAGVARGTQALGQLAAGAFAAFDSLRADGVEMEGGGNGFLYVDGDVDRLSLARESAAARAEAFGLEAPGSVLRDDELHEFEPALAEGVRYGYFAPSERYIDPGRFVDRLIERVREAGVRIVEHTRVTRVESRGGQVIVGIESGDAGGGAGGGAGSGASSGELTARQAVVAAGAWSGELLRGARLRLPIAPGKGYSLTVPTATMPRSLVHSAQDRVVATPMSGRLRIVGIMEFDRSYDRLNRDRLSLILKRAGHFLRGLDPSGISEEWTGPRPMTPSGLPMIGEAPNMPGVFVASGHNMHGLSLAPVTASMVAQLVRGEEPTVGGTRIDMRPFRVR